MFTGVLSTVLLFTNCTSSKKIYERFAAQSYSLSYNHEPVVPRKLDNLDVLIKLSGDSESVLSSTKVERDKGIVVPLIAFNYWKSVNTCSVGQDMMDENFPEFLQDALTEELDRSSIIHPIQGGDTPYRLEITIDSVGASGPYSSEGFAYFLLLAYGYSYSDWTGPGIANLNVSYKLYKNDEVLMENTVVRKKLTAESQYRYAKTETLQNDYGKFMVEAVSLCVKEVCEEISEELNGHFKSYGRPKAVITSRDGETPSAVDLQLQNIRLQ